MKEIFTGRLLLMALVFGSSGYGIKALFPFVERNIHFGAFGLIIAILTSLLISILIPKDPSKLGPYLNYGLILLLVISITSMILMMNRYNHVTFTYYDAKMMPDSTIRVNPDTVHYLHAGISGLSMDIRKAMKQNDEMDADPKYIVENYGGFTEYLRDKIWRKEALDGVELGLFIYYIIFLLALIGATFTFLEILKYRRYSDEIPKAEPAP